MPPKKPFRRDTKKKSSKMVAVAVPHAGSSTCADSSDFPKFDNDVVDGIGVSPTASSESAVNENSTVGKGLYGIYKRATQRFKEGLMDLVPSEIFARDRVQTLMDAVDYIVDQQQKIDPQLLKDCRISMQFRKKFSKQFADGGDEGHDYFVLVLGYCFQSLRQLAPEIKEERDHKNSRRFSFADLDVDSDEEDEGVDDYESPTPPVRPQEPDVEYTLDDLVESSDRCQAILFLYNVEKCMMTISNLFTGIKKMTCCLRDYSVDDPSYVVGPLLRVAAATNFTIRHVQIMEEELEANFPHLSTFYRVLASIFFYHKIDEFMTFLKGIGKVIPRSEVTGFVGDIIEQAFRPPMQEFENVVSDFANQWSLPYDEVEKRAQGVVVKTLFEIQPFQDIVPRAFPYTQPPHQWLRPFKYIGGDRSILNTQVHVQHVLRIPKLYGLDCVFGPLWDEQHCLAEKIHGDMDELLMKEILPDLLYTCAAGSLSRNVPWTDELLPLVKMVKDFLDKPTKPIPLALTFGIHAILTSIFVLQGDGDVTTVANVAKNAYSVYFDRLDDLLNSPDFPTFGYHPVSIKNLMKYQELTATPHHSETFLSRSFWNPCSAGMFLNYLNVNVNMAGGAPSMNRLEQLRIILHLRNAFEQRGLSIGDIPLLTSLDKYLEGDSYVWGGEKPKRDSMVKKFWMAYGLKAEVLRGACEDCRHFVMEQTPGGFQNFKRRDTASLNPGNISKTYRKICRGDFGRMEETDPETVSDKFDLEWKMSYLRYVGSIMATMADEEELSSWNLAALGCCLTGFLTFLSDRLGWKEHLDETVAKMRIDEEVRRRTRSKGKIRGKTLDQDDFSGLFNAQANSLSFLCSFVYRILGPLDFLDEVESDENVVITRDCMIEYFTQLDPAKYKIYGVFPLHKKSDDSEMGATEDEGHSEHEILLDDDSGVQVVSEPERNNERAVSEPEHDEEHIDPDQALA